MRYTSRDSTSRPRRGARLLPRLFLLLLLSLAPTGCMLIAATAAGGAASGAAVASVVGENARPRSVGTAAASFPLGASVAVTLAPSRDVAVVGRRPGDTTWVRDAYALTGRVAGARGDTLSIALSEVTSATGPRATYPRRHAPTAAVVPSPAAKVRVIAARPAIAERAFLGAIAGAALAVAALVAILQTMGDVT